MSDKIEIISNGNVSVAIGEDAKARVFINGTLAYNKHGSAMVIYEEIRDIINKAKISGNDMIDVYDDLIKIKAEAYSVNPNHKRVIRLAKSIEAILKAQE